MKTKTFVISCLVFAIIIVIAFGCLISLYNDYWKKTSEQRGDGFDIENQFRMEHFSYNSVSVALQNDLYAENPDKYFYEIELLPTDFDGLKYNYELTMNETTCSQLTQSAGKIVGVYTFAFMNENGDVANESELVVDITFLSDKSILNVSCIGSENASYWAKFFQNYGLRLTCETVI